MSIFSQKNGSVREPAVAGYFYPADPEELKKDINQFINEAKTFDFIPKAVISPHAGYPYSGPIAGAAYRALSSLKGPSNRIVLIGPAHRVYTETIALHSAEYFKTPLGLVPLDIDARMKLEKEFRLVPENHAHEMEHSLEVQLPFLQTILPEIKVLPMVTGDCVALLSRVMDFLWNDSVFVISSDLSHYLHYDEAVKKDMKTKSQILNFEQISSSQACGSNGINALSSLASAKNLKVKALDLRNSGDTAGGRDRVVGYGAFAYWI